MLPSSVLFFSYGVFSYSHLLPQVKYACDQGCESNRYVGRTNVQPDSCAENCQVRRRHPWSQTYFWA